MKERVEGRKRAEGDRIRTDEGRQGVQEDKGSRARIFNNDDFNT